MKNIEFARKICVAALAALSLGSVAQGVELGWRNVRATGGGDGERCYFREGQDDRNNTYWTSAGGEFSVLFRSFGISLPAERVFWGRAMARSASCNIEAEMVIPQGHYLSTFKQILIGGVQKSPGTTGGISSNGFVFQQDIPLNQINIVFRAEERHDIGDWFEQENTQRFQDWQKKIQCATTALAPMRTRFKLQILAAGARVLPIQAFVLNVDSNDVSFRITEPELLPCADLFR